MEDDSLTALSQREGAFWFAVGLIAVGSLVSSSFESGSTLVGLGMAILVVRVLVAFHRILQTSGKAGKVGYEEGKHHN